MRRFTLVTVLTLIGVALTADPADAQFRRWRDRYRSPDTYVSYYPGTYSYYTSPYSYSTSPYGYSASPYGSYLGSPYSYSAGSSSYPAYGGGAWSGGYTPGTYGGQWDPGYSAYASPYTNAYPPAYGGGYSPGYAPAGGGAELEYIRSMYRQYLGREPDPEGVQTWMARLAQFNGDTSRLMSEFITAAQRERLSNTPGYYPYGYR